MNILGTSDSIESGICILGIPYDPDYNEITHCSLAPYILRKLSHEMNLSQGYIYDHRQQSKILDGISVSDIGDLSIDSSESEESFIDRIYKASKVIFENNKKLISIGGVHVITYPLLKAASKVYDNIQVIQLDAHSDIQRVSPKSKLTHANFVNFSCEIESIVSWIQIGVRAVGSHVVPSLNKVNQCDVEELSDIIDPSIPVYLSIDLDVFDPHVFPAVAYPVPNGIMMNTFDNLISYIKEKNINIIGVDICEYDPKFDTNNYISGIFVIYLLLKILKVLSDGE